MASVLLIEDSDGQRAEVRSALEDSGLFDGVLEASDAARGLERMAGEPVDLVICDLDTAGLDDEQLLRLREQASRAEVPVPLLLVTASTDPEHRARLLREGASDALSKPVHSADLIARVGLHLKLVQAQRELLAKNLELERLSTTDALTGLPNRRRLDEALAAEFARSKRNGLPLAVVMIDVDLFKRVNDEHGHAAGDAVLIAVGRALAGIVRETDCCGRFGGDEFLAILTHNDLHGALVFAERLRRKVNETAVELDDGQSVSVSLSVGIAEWQSGTESPKRLLAQADAALYAAKASGRDCVRVHSGESASALCEGVG